MTGIQPSSHPSDRVCELLLPTDMSQNFPFPFHHPSNTAPPPQPPLPQQHNQHPQTAAMPPSNPPAPSPAAQAQQAAAFLQNAQLGELDMSVLQNISPEQLAAIGQLIQAGLFPLPQVQNSVQAPAQAPAPVQPNVVAQQNGIAKPQEDHGMDLDKEEGEWEDGEIAPQAEPDFLRPPPTGPRKRSGSAHRNGNDKRVRRQQSPPRQQPKGYDRRRPERRPSDHFSSPQSPVRQRRAKHDAAKAFILAAYRAGFTFDDLAREVGDARMLSVLFRELDLNLSAVEPRPAQQKAPAVAPLQPVPNVTGTPSTAPAADSVAKSAATRIPASKAPAPAPADRSAYLARLQAAKNKKNEPSPSATAEPPVKDTPSPAAVQQPKKATIQTDLIRRKLEALKAEQARRQEAERLASAATIPERTKSFDASLPQPESKPLPGSFAPSQHQHATPPIASPQPTVAATQPVSFTSQFPGLPGLFMSGGLPSAPVQSTSMAPAGPKGPLSTPFPATNPNPSAPVATQPTSDSNSSSRLTSAHSSPHVGIKGTTPANDAKPAPGAPQSGMATPKHPFNQGRYDSNDESVIINVSEDEESELDDEMEEDEKTVLAPAANPPTPASKPGPLRNFPVQSASAAASPVVTPGATTPGGTAYHRKLQEIEEMNRRIAEMQKQAKKPKASTKPPVAPTPMTAFAPSVDTRTSTTLPGLSSSTADAAVANTAAMQPAEPQTLESSQHMQAKLAQLKEEAEMISEKVTNDPIENARSFPPAKSDDPNANGATASSKPSDDDIEDDDDDDAMDLSSGEDSETESESDNGDPKEAPVNSNMKDEPHQMDVEPVQTLPQQDSDTSDDSDDSSTDSESDREDESEEDEHYEPSPAVPDVVMPDAVTTEPVRQTQPAALPGLGDSVVSENATAVPETSPQDADLAPELQAPARGEDNATPEVRQLDPAPLLY